MGEGVGGGDGGHEGEEKGEVREGEHRVRGPVEMKRGNGENSSHDDSQALLNTSTPPH